MERDMTKERLCHRIKRVENRLNDLNEKQLSEHGQWSKGYWTGVLTILKDWLDELEECSDGHHISN